MLTLFASRHRDEMFVAVVCLLAVSGAGQVSAGEKTMTQGGETAIAIRAGGQPAPLPRFSAGSNARGFLRRGANEQLNSRLEHRLPGGRWELAWDVSLDGTAAPSFVLQADERIILPLGTLWEMFDLRGQRIRRDSLGDGEMVADPAYGLLYAPSPSGYVNAHDLKDGHLVFSTLGYGGRTFQHQLIARRGDRLLVVSVETQADPHGRYFPSKSVIEVQSLGDPPRISDTGLLLSARVVQQEVLETLSLPAALINDTLVTALPNRLTLSDLEGRRRELTGAFEPSVLSLDETGRIYLVCRCGPHTELWVVTSDGTREMAAALPADALASTVPPLVGYDHRAYVVAGTRIVAIERGGRAAWTHDAGAPPAATVTADDLVLVAAGTDLVALNEKGEPRLVYRFDRQLSTPPVLTARGELLVASRDKLFCLRARTQP
jgi:hypothetical protein